MAHVFGVTGRKAEVDPRKNKLAKFLNALVSSFWRQRGALALPPPQLCDRANSTHANFPRVQGDSLIPHTRSLSCQFVGYLAIS